MYCKKCGNKLEQIDNYCTNCSHPTPWNNKIKTSLKNSKPIKDIQQLKSFYGKLKLIVLENRIKVAIGIIIIISCFLTYYFFIKPNPERDAKKIALMTYVYENKFDSLKLFQYNKFNNEFELHHYKDRNEANNDLEAYLLVAIKAISKEEENVKSYTKKMELKYENDYKNQNTYLTSLSLNKSMYNRYFLQSIKNASDKSTEKINSIIGDIPTTEKITSDLIGKSLLDVWNFNYLSDIKEIIISHSNITDKYAELIANIKVGNDNSDINKTYNFKNVILQYYFNESGEWVLNNIDCNQYDINLHLKYEWYSFYVPSNCSYTIYCNGQLGFAREYGFWNWNEKIEIGGNNSVHFTSNQIQFASHSKDEILDLNITITKN